MFNHKSTRDLEVDLARSEANYKLLQSNYDMAEGNYKGVVESFGNLIAAIDRILGEREHEAIASVSPQSERELSYMVQMGRAIVESLHNDTHSVEELRVQLERIEKEYLI